MPLEIDICLCAATLRRDGIEVFHGYEIAKRIGEERGHRLLAAYGTLYRALGRLETMGFLESRWEDPQIAARENRPGRRLYTLTPAGETAAAGAQPSAAPARGKRAVRRPVTA